MLQKKSKKDRFRTQNSFFKGERSEQPHTEDGLIDPSDPNLFRDEIVDIDFGAIDAYTSALNAQINSAQSGSDAQGANELSFPSHILTSNHATFLDNQMLLGDATYYAQDEAGSGDGEELAQGSEGDPNTDENNNNVNVQLLNSFREFEHSTNASFAQLNVNNNSTNQNESHAEDNNDEENNANEEDEGRYEDENVDYSNSHSFGSVVDIDNGQPGYTIGNLSNFNFNLLNLSQNNQNFETVDGKSSKQQQQSSNSGIYYLNSENQENFYVR
jgi:hypothetical protein